MSRKAKYLRQHLKRKIADAACKDQLNVLLCLRESGKMAADLIAKYLKGIEINGVTLLPADVQAIGSAINYATTIDCLSLRQCALNDDLLCTLWNCVKSSSTTVSFGRHSLNSVGLFVGILV